MISYFPPFIMFFFGAFLSVFLSEKLRKIVALITPLLALLSFHLIKTPIELFFCSQKLVIFQSDKINLPFFYAFIIISLLGIIYNLNRNEKEELVFPMLYAGSAVGLLFTQDFISLFFFWELMAIFSTFVIWLGRTEKSNSAGLRYLLVHLTGGVLFFTGIVLLQKEVGNLQLLVLNDQYLSSWLILTAVIINAAVPPFSAWLSDAYPESSIGGTVFLSAFTTKSAVYILCKLFAGWDILIYLGSVMAVYGVIYAFLVLDIRRLLSYHIISQVGFMVTGVGIGTTLSINGTVSHAFTHIVYKGLLMMSAGAILYATKRERLNEQGGLIKELRSIFIFYSIGALSISGAPFLSGFVSKSITITSTQEVHNYFAWFMLNVASTGTFISVGLKLPYLAFFGEKRVENNLSKIPLNIKWAMILASTICVVIGVFPKLLYSLLPYDMQYLPYTLEHIIFVLQLFLGAFLVFLLYMRHLDAKNFYIVLDTDWFYRRGTRFLIHTFNIVHDEINDFRERVFYGKIYKGLVWFVKNPLSAVKIFFGFLIVLIGFSEKEKELEKNIHKYPEDMVKHWPIGITILYTAFLLMLFLIIYYIY